MSKKQWFLGACGALLIGGLAASANAKATFDIVVKSVDGVTVPGGSVVGGGAKSVILDHVGQAIRMEAWLELKGDDADYNEAFSLVIGSLLSYKGADLQAIGTGKFSPAGRQTGIGANKKTQWWNVQTLSGGNGTVPDYALGNYPTEQNLFYPGKLDDGSPDLGDFATASAELGGVMAFRAGSPVGSSMIPGVTELYDISQGADGPANIIADWDSGNPSSFKIRLFTFDWTVGSLNSGLGKTLINWQPRLVTGDVVADNAIIFYLDGKAGSSTQQFDIGAPVVLEVVPEPAGLSILALGALGLLARRRK